LPAVTSYYHFRILILILFFCHFFGVIHSIVESNVEDRAKTGAPVTKAPKPTKVPVKTTNSHGAKTTHARKNLNAGRASTKAPVVR